MTVTMDDHPLTPIVMSLAGHAADLSTNLYSIQETVGHDTTSADISSVAGEIALLSTTLWRLHEAMATEPELYTQSFNDDLAEITRELKLIFDEISDCCVELQKADDKTLSTGWLFRKGRVQRLQKHLEALKTTLIVMRTVLWHGKDYGNAQSPPNRLFEPSRQSMHEDRVILESVFSKNRDAIIELHNLEESRCHRHTPSTSTDTTDPSGNQSGSLSPGFRIENPPIPDGMPMFTPEKRKPCPSTNAPSRRFSKRGVRLAVHMSMLDMGAHEAPQALKNKWVQRSRSNRSARKAAEWASMSSGQPPLLKIPEVDSTNSVAKTEKTENPTVPDGLVHERIVPLEEENVVPDVSNNQHGPEGDDGRKREPLNDADNDVPTTHSATKGLRKLWHRLTITKPDHIDDTRDENEESSRGSDDKGIGSVRRKLSALVGVRSPLRTPDFEKEFENGAAL